MDERTLEKLEFPAIRQALACECVCSLGRERAEALRPATDAVTVRARLAETSEARRMIDHLGPLPLGGISDIRDHLRRARVGSALSGGELLAVGACLRGMRRARAAIDSCHPDDYPLLTGLAGRLGDHRAIEDLIEASIAPDGSVVDDASPELRRLRTRVGVLRTRIEMTMRSFLAQHAEGSRLQDRLVTTRRGRPCVPVKASAKGSVPGVVHDVSSSGQTLFIEPQAVVGLGDELQQAMAAEQEEVDRILRELSGRLGQVADEYSSPSTPLASSTSSSLAAASHGGWRQRARSSPMRVY